MTSTPFQSLICPLEGHPLTFSAQSLQCDQGHTFDVARHGYVNLLPVQHKRSSDPGDSKAMVAARQRFLGAGHYAPVAEAVSRHVLSGSPDASPLACLDAGCGEGYYLRALTRAAGDGQALSLVGVDISKWAVQAGARQDVTKAASWIVGSNAHLPVASASLDAVLCMFGFPVFDEFARVLKPGGRLVMVEAGSDHLRELREIIYPSLNPDKPERDRAPDGFERGDSERVRHQCTLDTSEAISDLLTMTPHLYRATAEGRARAAALTALEVTLDVRVTVLIKQ
ncbi:putative RNA methyltransferase [Larsenimonas salina]|uniref:putative RNA methyltransferase n=1 Tax=Larsenimonas salina TaxID=1295565 RepID=UPI002074575F|nr:methyltransferase domain-containing protein [Larsenimonas salina]MCM5704019.1 methyltransferase domain-containing protein [Larsenimonas salina]